MSWKQWIPQIVEQVDFTSVCTYLASYNVITVEECYSLNQQLQNGLSLNSTMMQRMLPRIEDNPRNFYRALRESVNGNAYNINRMNKKLFDSLPKNFGKEPFVKKFKRKLKENNQRKITCREELLSSGESERTGCRAALTNSADNAEKKKVFVSSIESTKSQDSCDLDIITTDVTSSDETDCEHSDKQTRRWKNVSKNFDDLKQQVKLLETRVDKLGSQLITKEEEKLDQLRFEKKELVSKCEKQQEEQKEAEMKALGEKQILENRIGELESLLKKYKEGNEEMESDYEKQQGKQKIAERKAPEEEKTLKGRVAELESLLKEKTQVQESKKDEMQHQLTELEFKCRNLEEKNQKYLEQLDNVLRDHAELTAKVAETLLKLQQKSGMESK